MGGDSGDRRVSSSLPPGHPPEGSAGSPLATPASPLLEPRRSALWPRPAVTALHRLSPTLPASPAQVTAPLYRAGTRSLRGQLLARATQPGHEAGHREPGFLTCEQGPPSSYPHLCFLRGPVAICSLVPCLFLQESRGWPGTRWHSATTVSSPWPGLLTCRGHGSAGRGDSGPRRTHAQGFSRPPCTCLWPCPSRHTLPEGSRVTL